LTLFKSSNSLIFSSTTLSNYFLMLIPYLLVLAIIVIWYFLKREDFSTLRLGLGHIREIFTKKSRNEFSLRAALGVSGLFFTLSFIVPGFIEFIVSKRIEQPDLFPSELVSLVYAITYVVIVGLAIIVLTYEPTKVYDVLLVKMPDGIPIAQRLKLFQSDEVLISGFFTAISIEPVGFGTMCGITHLNGSGLLFATGILYQAPFVWFEISTLRRTSERWVPNETGSREE